MLKRFITFLLTLTLFVLPISAKSIDLFGIEEQISNYENRIIAAENIIQAAKDLGYPEGHQLIQTAVAEVTRANNNIAALKQERIVLKRRLGEYPEATYIWNYLKSLGYNDYVCAGIMGNIMVEVGGGTLQLKPNAYGKGYYGICQWSKNYRDVWGKSLDYQCNYLESNIEHELNTFGKLYQKGFNYNQFTQLTNARSAALAFAKCYERCNAKGYAKRQNCAEIAYNYFV